VGGWSAHVVVAKISGKCLPSFAAAANRLVAVDRPSHAVIAPCIVHAVHHLGRRRTTEIPIWLSSALIHAWCPAHRSIVILPILGVSLEMISFISFVCIPPGTRHVVSLLRTPPARVASPGASSRTGFFKGSTVIIAVGISRVATGISLPTTLEIIRATWTRLAHTVPIHALSRAAA